MVMADRGQIEQAIINLVVNACDAIAGSGRILITVGAVDVAEGMPATGPDCGPGSYVMLSVADTGFGMDEDTLKHVFEPFFTTKEVGKGTGLGLAMVHGVVKQSGGSIVAESRQGTGTTFRIYLPRIAGDEKAAAPAETAVPRRVKGHESILLVEDQEQVRELAVAVLRHAGYSVDSAADGQSALMLAEKLALPVDLLLTDVVMPLMSGPELATQIRERSPGTRVLYISGYTSESLAADGVREEQAQYLSKPFTPAQLLDKVRSTLDE
jgi:CheY-like chemotaxis protein